MNAITNPIGDPHFDFVKETMIETLLSEVENEVYWKLLQIPEDKSPQMTEVYDTQTGFKKGWLIHEIKT